MRWLTSPLLTISIASFLVSVFLLNHTERLRLDGVVDTTHRGTDSRHEPISPSVLGHDYNLQVAASTPDYTLPLLPVADREAVEPWHAVREATSPRVEATEAIRVAAFPVFLKLHVVGSTSFSTMLRCYARAGIFPPYNVSRGDRSWSSSCCGQMQGHEAALIFSMRGPEALAACVPSTAIQRFQRQGLALAPAIRLVLILRDPLEKLVSALLTFGDDATVALLRHGHSGGKGNGTSARSQWGANMVDVKHAISAVFGGQAKAVSAREALRERDLRMIRGSATEIRDIIKSPSRLRVFAAIGYTEEFPRFIALASLVLHWPEELACLPERNLHVGPARPPAQELLSLSVQRGLSQFLRVDREIYIEARRLHHMQARRYGARFEQRLAIVRRSSERRDLARGCVIPGGCAGATTKRASVPLSASSSKCRPWADWRS